jgi:hypothetical protein
VKTTTGTIPVTTGGNTPPTAEAAGSTGCMRIIAGRKRVKLRRYGVLRLKLVKNACLAAPVAVKVRPRKGTALASVRYKLDGKRVVRSKKVRFGATLRVARLTAGKHTLKVRVKPVGGTAKTFKTRLRLGVA